MIQNQRLQCQCTTHHSTEGEQETAILLFHQPTAKANIPSPFVQPNLPLSGHSALMLAPRSAPSKTATTLPSDPPLPYPSLHRTLPIRASRVLAAPADPQSFLLSSLSSISPPMLSALYLCSRPVDQRDVPLLPQLQRGQSQAWKATWRVVSLRKQGVLLESVEL